MNTVWHSVQQLQNEEGQLVIEGCRAADLVKEFGSPLYVYSESRIRENYHRLLRAYQKRYPNFAIFYAVKANNNAAIVQILSNEGAGMDCSCMGEISIARGAGIPSNKQIFTGVFPSRDDFQEAISYGTTINIDNLADLKHVAEIGVPDILSFRINPERGESGEEGLVFAGPDAKFGIPINKVEEAYSQAKALGVKRFGVHTMTGSNILDPKYFGEMVTRLLDIVGPIANKLGIRYEFIDIGGSLGIPYQPDHSELDVEAVADAVVKTLKRKLTEYKLGEPLLIHEPGRYLVGDAGVLLTTVRAIKESLTPFVGLDAGMNTLLRPALYNTYHHILLANHLNPPHDTPFHIVGPICENTDMFALKRPLPRQITQGDILAILDVGAYGFCMSSQYNTRPRAAEVLICNGKAEIIREKENIFDITRHIRIPERLGEN